MADTKISDSVIYIGADDHDIDFLSPVLHDAPARHAAGCAGL